MSATPGLRFSVVLFDDVELLDVAGPVEVLSKVDGFEVEIADAIELRLNLNANDDPFAV